MIRLAKGLQRVRQAYEITKFQSAINALRSAPEKKLQSVEFVADCIRRVGLVHDERTPYGTDNRFMNSGPYGLWQIPVQLARCLVRLSDYEINSMIEIGTWFGWTSTFMGVYLRRFNPQFQMTTVDIGSGWVFTPQPLVPVHVHIGTSADFCGQRFDLAFIDGDHSYKWCLADYQNVGRNAGICMFHDINDKFVLNHGPNDGGVPRLWAELKSSAALGDQVFEYLDHSEQDQIMGIGLAFRSMAAQREHLGFRNAQRHSIVLDLLIPEKAVVTRRNQQISVAPRIGLRTRRSAVQIHSPLEVPAER